MNNKMSLTNRPYFLALWVALFLIGAIDIAHSEEVAPSYKVTSDEVESIAAAALEEMGAGENIAASLVGRYQRVLYRHASPFNVELNVSDYDARAMRWHGDLIILSNDEEVESIPLSGRYEALIEVPVLTRRLHRSDIIEEADLEWVAVPEHRLRKDVLMSAEELIGKAPRRVISEGRPIREAEIENPIITAKGDIVQVIYTTPFMELRTIGMALEEGAKGDHIRIRNSESDIVIHATLLDEGIAQVSNPLQTTLNTRLKGG